MSTLTGAENVVRRSVVHKMKNGQKIVLWAWTLQDWIAVRDQSLFDYKRKLIQTWTANADLLPVEDRSRLIQEAFQRAEKLSYADLPDKQVADSAEPIEYAQWWCDQPEGVLFLVWRSMRHEPSQREMTLDDAESLFIDAFADLNSAARIVHDLSAPRLGKANGELAGTDPTQPATTPPGETKRERRRRRRRERQPTTGQ